MNVLVLASRFPWPAYTGDRMRASIWLTALAPHARVALVAPRGDVPAGVPAFRYFPAERSVVRGVRGALRVVREQLPIQSLLAAPFDWDRAISAAHEELGPFDATIVILSRTDPWVRTSFPLERRTLSPAPRRAESPALQGGRRSIAILDSIDSLRRNSNERAEASRGPMRWFWQHEAARLARVERELGNAYDSVVVVSEDEVSEFGSAGLAIPNSVPIAPLDPSAPRRYDFGFWGRLAYFANADAARWLLHEIVPAIRTQYPNTSIVMGGADAPHSIRVAAEKLGVDFQSPIADVAAFARNVRVAVVPMRYGSGQSSKLLEAAEAGCAIVTTPQALRGLPRLAPHVSIASDAESFATQAIELLKQPSIAARRAVEQHHSRERVLAAMAELAGVARKAKAVGA